MTNVVEKGSDSWLFGTSGKASDMDALDMSNGDIRG
jgi:hypothetical protein